MFTREKLFWFIQDMMTLIKEYGKRLFQVVQKILHIFTKLFIKERFFVIGIFTEHHFYIALAVLVAGKFIPELFVVAG